MNGFSAYHISSRDLKYALAFSSFEDGEIKEEEYKKALLNVLTAQDFDSIPLVESYGGPITAIGRRRLHDGDVDDVFILSTKEVSKLPRKASVIRCIFEVLSNEHHIVFLTDEEDQIQDVVTIGMLSSPIIQEYLTLLVSKLSSENWDFNEKYLKSSFTPTYDFPKIIHEELKKLGKLVDDADGAIPTDFDVSKQIVHILSLLQPLKHWEGGQESDSLLSTDFPLTIATPDYIPGTAGYFAQHPFGAVMENTEEEVVQDLAFRLFSEANNWDHLVLKTSSGDYSHLLGKDELKLEMEEPVAEDTELEELVHLFDEQNRPLQVKYKHSPYPGIISAQDIVFSEYNKGKTLRRFIDLEINIRDTYMHLIGQSESPTESAYHFSGNTPWKLSITSVYEQLITMLSEQFVTFDLEQFTAIISIRNGMAHNDFSTQPNDEIDPKKTNDYLLLLTHYIDPIRDFNRECEIINCVPYTEFISRLTKECMSYEHMPEEIPTNFSWGKEIVYLKFIENTFMLYLKTDAVIQHVENVKIQLEKRDFPWSFRILSYREHPYYVAINTLRKKLLAALRLKITKMLVRNLDENNQIEYRYFKEQMKPIWDEIRTDFKITNSDLIEKFNLSASSIKKGTTGILDPLEIRYENSTPKTGGDGKKNFLRIIDLDVTEEE